MWDAARTEINELHRFFEDWFLGALPPEAREFDRFLSVMDPSFVLVNPAGQSIPLDLLAQRLRDAHGSRPPGSFSIEARPLSGRSPVPGLLVASYEEWHVTEAGRSGRISTALFATGPETPNGVRWLHVHETYLPTM